MKDPRLKSNGPLAQMYAAYNEAYFFGSLPESVPVRWDADVPKDSVADLQIWITGDEVQFAIRLSPIIRFSEKQYRMALIHEMVHVYLYPYLYHGAKFDAEMLRLACAGAFNGLW